MDNFDGLDEFEEFDWFPEQEPENDYDNIADLKNSSYEVFAEYEVIDGHYEYGETEEDEQMWHYTEGLQQTMDSVFSGVYEKLCGEEIGVSSNYLYDYTDKLSEKAVVIQTNIHGDNLKENCSELNSVIKACLCESGEVIAIVPNDAWNESVLGKETEFFDDGMRAVQIIGIRDGVIIVNDYNNENGKGLEISSETLCKMYGILLEVYK